MKPLPLPALAVPALATTLALTGCTVHNHYYGDAGPTPPGAIATHAESPGHAVLADQLAGVHTAMDVAATNLANVNAIGYKARRVTFVEGQAQPNITLDWTVGSPEITDRPLDLFIEGDGFFKIDIPYDIGGGVAYTRRGQFFVNRDGDIVLGNSDGPRLSDGINISGDVKGINFAANGEVNVVRPDNSLTNVGMICLHTFIAPDGLEALGNGFYAETESSGPATEAHPGQGPCGKLAQGMLESSNVRLIMEMVELKKLSIWADAISEEIGLSAYQRLTYQDSNGTLQTALDATDLPGIIASRADFEELIRQQNLGDSDNTSLHAGLEVRLLPRQRNNRPDSHMVSPNPPQAGFDTLLNHDD